MEILRFNQKQLAVCWNISEAALERWRSEGIGPRHLKIGGRVLYRQQWLKSRHLHHVQHPIKKAPSGAFFIFRATTAQPLSDVTVNEKQVTDYKSDYH